MIIKNRSIRSFLLLALTAAMLLSLGACSFEVERMDGAEPAAAPAQTTAPAQSDAPAAEEQASVEEEPEEEIIEEEVIDGTLLTDDDNDGIIRCSFNYKGATVYAMIVLDPSRIFVGTAVDVPGQMYGYGKTLDVLVEEYDAVAGTNAGGFVDQDGAGSGWPARGITYGSGDCYTTEEAGPVTGFTDDNTLWAGYYTYDVTELMDMRDAVSFGPTLVENGERVPDERLESGLGARTAIGQREDGAVVLMVADGRQGYSIGLTMSDSADIMCYKFNCVTAANMDGGNSSCMAWGTELVNNPSNQAGGTRALPTAWLVRKLPANYVRPEGVPTRVILPVDVFGESNEGKELCDEELSARLAEFADRFVDTYYDFFGTSHAYGELRGYLLDGSDLSERMSQAMMDRMWVNTYANALNNKTFERAYNNGDGTYTIEYTLDIVEYSTYWTYEANNTHLKIIVVDAPDSLYGFRAIATE